jgi:uncharacterized protein YkwD
MRTLWTSRTLVLVLALLAALFAVGARDAGPARAEGGACPNAATNVADLPLPDFESSVTCLINEQRAQNGLAALRPNGLLHDAAWIYATSMLSGDFYNHYGCLNGRNDCSTPIGRLRLLGYIRPGWAWVVGETLRGAHPDTSTPGAVVDAWMESPEHRVELLKPRFRDVGVAAILGVTDAFPATDGVTVDAEFGFHQRRK